MKTIADSKAQLQTSSDQLEGLLLRPEQLHQDLGHLKQERADLQTALAAKEKEIATIEAPLAAIPAEAERYARAQQEAEDRINRAREVIGQLTDLGSNDEDLSFLAGLDNIRVNAVAAIRRCL